ncbi:hypothetical protein [Granulicella arctica]|uniref:Uncharacterized protein n=1 Tax=Granulicella arctica TaxID=940613 RepID=A0A7Y9PFU3_9BACT|nr:hypothetical protein [Granulicella arctica]NYF79111.1 hypothetical protein [Granulicella arctica]
MALWGPLTQNGNTTLGWTVSGGGITNHEAFAVQLDSTSPNNSTGALISNVIVFINPTRYNVNITTEGPQAISYHINSDGV